MFEDIHVAAYSTIMQAYLQLLVMQVVLICEVGIFFAGLSWAWWCSWCWSKSVSPAWDMFLEKSGQTCIPILMHLVPMLVFSIFKLLRCFQDFCCDYFGRLSIYCLLRLLLYHWCRLLSLIRWFLSLILNLLCRTKEVLPPMDSPWPEPLMLPLSDRYDPLNLRIWIVDFSLHLEAYSIF